jgi:hypothetical protein
MRLGGPPASLHGAPARAGVVRMWRSPMPRAKCDHRTVLRLRIEAAVRLWGSANRPGLGRAPILGTSTPSWTWRKRRIRERPPADPAAR